MTFIKAKSVASILGDFNKKIKELEQLAQDKSFEAVQKEELAAQTLTEANAANREANKALAAAEKIKAITE